MLMRLVEGTCGTTDSILLYLLLHSRVLHILFLSVPDIICISI